MAQSQSGFYGKGSLDRRNDIIEKCVNHIRVGQHPAATLFFGHHGIRAAQVPVNGRVTQIIQIVGKGRKICGCFAHDLRDNRQPEVIFRQDVFDILFLDDVIPFFAGDKGCHSQIKPAKMVCKCCPEQMIRKALQGGHV